MSKAIGFMGLVLCAVGCGSAPVDAGSTDDEAAVITRTVVGLAADGSQEVRVERITRATQLQEIADRTAYIAEMNRGSADGVGSIAAPLLTWDTGCDGQSVWLFDQENLHGNELCFKSGAVADAAYLTDYTRWTCPPGLRRCIAHSWDASVRSLWGGVDPGMLQLWPGDTPGMGCDYAFNAYQVQNTLAPRAKASAALVLLKRPCQ